MKLRDIFFICLAVIFLVISVATGMGLFGHTVHNVNLAAGLLVVSFLLTPWAFGKAMCSEGEVFELEFYLKLLIVWTFLFFFVVCLVVLVTLLSII